MNSSKHSITTFKLTARLLQEYVATGTKLMLFAMVMQIISIIYTHKYNYLVDGFELISAGIRFVGY